MNPANYMKENNVGRELRNVFSIVVPFYVGYIYFFYLQVMFGWFRCSITD